MADKFGKKLRMMNEPDIKVLICGEIINLDFGLSFHSRS